MKNLFIVAILTLLYEHLPAQENTLPDMVKQTIEDIAANAEEDEPDISTLYEFYESLLEHPLNLNNVTAEELGAMQILNDFQIQSLIEYRKTYGQLYSVYELPLIHGFNEHIAQQLAPFITVEEVNHEIKENFINRFTRGTHQIMLRTARTLETREGYEQDEEKNHYLGLPWNLHLRYRYKYKDKLQWGLTATNGPGEPFFSGINARGFDFYSAHIVVRDLGPIQQIVVGDYQVQFGQGLTVWSGSGGWKSSDIAAVKKQERGFTAHTGSDENRFFRGIAGTVSCKQWRFSSFVSYKSIDAAVDSLGFSSLQTSGAHNTSTTAANKHSLPEFITGGNISHKWEHIKVGCTGLWHAYGANNNRNLSLYNYFELAKRQNFNLGVDFYAFHDRKAAFGEIALSDNGCAAGLLGLLFELSNDFRLSTLYRHYDRAYQALYANGFGKDSKTTNEKGWYVGMQWLPHTKLTISAFADIFSFPWMRYNVNAPSSGWEYALRAAWQITPKIMMSLQLKQSSRETNNSNDDSHTKQIVTNNKTGLRYHIKYELLSGLRMEDHLELSFIDGSVNETGSLLYHDFHYKLPIWTWTLNLSARFAIFDTGSWATRFYAYESDVLYAFSVPAYYSQGIRWYLNIYFSFGKHLELWLRAAQSNYYDKTSIGSNLTSIKGSRQADVKMQIRIQL